MKTEFFVTADGLEIIAQQNGNYTNLKNDFSLIKLMRRRIDACFPKASQRLDKDYETDYDKVLRFCKCNFSLNDHIPDMVEDGFNVEFIPCPLRGECKDENVICNPILKTGITVRETEIVQHILDGELVLVIADKLCLSPYTVENHKRNIYNKLNIHTIAELAKWAYKNKIA